MTRIVTKYYNTSSTLDEQDKRYNSYLRELLPLFSRFSSTVSSENKDKVMETISVGKTQNVAIDNGEGPIQKHTHLEKYDTIIGHILNAEKVNIIGLLTLPRTFYELSRIHRPMTNILKQVHLMNKHSSIHWSIQKIFNIYKS